MPTDGQQLPGRPGGGCGVRLRAGEHLAGKAGGYAVEQHRAFPGHQFQALRQDTAPLQGLEAPAVPLRQVAADDGPVLRVPGLQGGPVDHGPAIGQLPGQPLAQHTLSAFAAAKK